MRRILVIGILLVSQGALFTTQNLAAAVMRTECEGAVRALDAKEELTFGAGYCAGFLRGTYDAITSMSQINLRPEYRVCSPETAVTTKQLISVYMDYIDRHPQAQQSSSHIMVLKAFHSEWPCSKSQLFDSRTSLIQSYLQKLGYKVGAIDGLLGDKTRSAIREFQEQNNLPVTGDISAELERALKDTFYKTTED